MGLGALHFSGASRLMHVYGAELGALISVGQVRPPRRGWFQPNRHREIDPEFLENAIVALCRADYDVVSLDDALIRIHKPVEGRRFVCFTLDVGYRDQAEHAWPIFTKFNVPFAQFITTGFADRLGLIWWRVVEAVIAQQDQIVLLADGREQRLDCRTIHEKRRIYRALVRWLWQRGTDTEIQSFVRDLAHRYSVDCADICARECLPWEAIAELAGNPLATVGAQSVNHPVLAKLPEAKVIAELNMSRAVIESAIGVRPRHFCYPFGGRDAAGPREFRIARELGYRSALTSRFGVAFAAHAAHLHALPRIPLSGDFQRVGYLRAMMSGGLSLMLNRFNPLDVE